MTKPESKAREFTDVVELWRYKYPPPHSATKLTFDTPIHLIEVSAVVELREELAETKTKLSNLWEVSIRERDQLKAENEKLTANLIICIKARLAVEQKLEKAVAALNRLHVRLVENPKPHADDIIASATIICDALKDLGVEG